MGAFELARHDEPQDEKMLGGMKPELDPKRLRQECIIAKKV